MFHIILYTIIVFIWSQLDGGKVKQRTLFFSPCCSTPGIDHLIVLETNQIILSSIHSTLNSVAGMPSLPLQIADAMQAHLLHPSSHNEAI